MSNLRAVVRIKHMAEAAAATGSADDYPYPEQGIEMAQAYERLREEARALCVRAGWGTDEEFDKEIPPASFSAQDLAGGDNSREDPQAAGMQARVLLKLLAAWAAGHQEAFELEEQMKATAKAKAEAAKAESRKPGFQ
jgi:hypothetical protein